MEPSTDVKIVMRNLSRSVDDLEISDGAKNWLRSANIVYVGNLVQRTEEDLMDLWFFSPMYLKEVKTCLWSIGLELGMEIPKRRQPTSDQLDKQHIGSSPIKITEEILTKLLCKVDELGFSVRLNNCLESADIIYVGDLVQKTEEELIEIRNFGRTCLNETKQYIENSDLQLGVIIPDWQLYAAEQLSREFYLLLNSLILPPTTPKLDHKTFIKLLLKVEDLDLTVRALHCFQKAKITFIGDLVTRTKRELLKIPNFGRKTLAEIRKKLAQMELHLEMQVPDWTPNNIREKQKLFARELEEISKPRQSFGNDFDPLEHKLNHLAALIKNERNQQIITKYFGWDGGGPNTLEVAGKKFDITRERVRQILNQFERKISWRGRRKLTLIPILDKHAHLVAKEAPGDAHEIEIRLAEQGITKKPFRIEGITKTAEFFNLEIPFRVVKLGKKRFVVRPEERKLPRIIAKLSRKTVGKKGVATVSDIAAQVQEEINQPIGTDFVVSVLPGIKGFRWLDEASEWFWLSSLPTGRNRLLNQIKKILSVVDDGIDISKLRSGVGRFHRMEGFAPPRRVLLELCRILPWCRVEDDQVIADPKLDWENILAGEIESVMCEVMKEHGPVLSRSEFEDLCLDCGMNRSSFFTLLTYSPIITKHAIGVYGLRGAKVLPGLVESLKPKRKPTRVIKDFGWTSKGQIWIGLKLSQGIFTSGVFGIPAGMKKHLQGNFSLRAADGASIGELKVKDSSAWSLSSFFRRRGGEPGDYLVLLFDPTSREATAYIGDEDLLDEFRPE